MFEATTLEGNKSVDNDCNTTVFSFNLNIHMIPDFLQGFTRIHTVQPSIHLIMFKSRMFACCCIICVLQKVPKDLMEFDRAIPLASTHSQWKLNAFIIIIVVIVVLFVAAFKLQNSQS